MSRDSAVEARFAALSDHEFVSQAHYAAQMLERHGSCYVALSPGDGTRYDVSIVTPPTRWQQQRYSMFVRDSETPLTFQQRFSGSYFVATNFGRMYRWEGFEIGDWTYVWEKWTNHREGTDEWTARVLFRFLNTLAPLLPAPPARPE